MTRPEPNEIAAATKPSSSRSAELAVDAGLHGGQDADESRTAEDDPGRNVRAFVGAGHHEPTTGLEPVTP